MGEELKTVLVVDDEKGMRDMLRWTLEEFKYLIVVARDGVEAGALLTRGGIDIVVTDITMPRLGGFDVLELAMKTVPRTPVIVMTGFGTVEMAVHAMRRGAANFLLKPFDARYLAASIQDALMPGARPASAAPS